jgi:hypothetical protein
MLHFVMSCVVPLLLAHGLHAAEEAGDAIAGTYDIRVCTGACSFDAPANVVVEGTVILFAKPLEKVDVDRFDTHRFASYFGESVNGCFMLERVGESSIYAGAEKVGVTSWSFENGRYGFSLYHSPDAGYQVSVDRTASGLSGTGASWGIGAAKPDSSAKQTVIARRTGDANLSNCTFETADEHELNRLLADPARTEMFAIETAYRKKLIAELQSSPSSRDWAMAGWLQNNEAADASILRARKAAPTDRFIRWMAVIRTRSYSVPVSMNGAAGFTIQYKEIDSAAASELQRTDSDNAYVWLLSLRDAVDRNDERDIDTALARLASSSYYDDHAAELLKAQLDLFRTHPLPDDYFAAVARLDAGWRLHGAFTKNVAPYYENHYPFADIGIHNLFFLSDEEGMQQLFSVCTRQSGNSAAREAACVKTARVLAAHARRTSARDSGSTLLSDIGDVTSDDRARAREQAWIAAKFGVIHPHVGKSERPFVRDDVAFIDDWIDTSDENEAMRKAVARVGKPLAPPADFSLDESMHPTIETKQKKHTPTAH